MSSRSAPPPEAGLVVTGDGLIESARHRAVATMTTRDERFAGYGAGATPELARARAEAECIERRMQFDPRPPVPIVAARLGELAGTVDPRTLGLYSARQYDTSALGCRRFSADEEYDWIAVRNATTGATAYVPGEFVYPRLERGRPPLVRETSSGTAAAPTRDAAFLAALCEVVERDAAMRFWYRQVVARAVPRAEIGCTDIRDDLDALAGCGFVVTVARLASEIALPTFIAFAQRGGDFWCGTATAPRAAGAIRHAVRELAASIAAGDDGPGANRNAPCEMTDLREPWQHAALYRTPPFDEIRRAFLAATVLPAPPGGSVISEEETVDGAQACALVAGAGFEVFEHDLGAGGSPRAAAVVRVLIPGLVPIHFGFGRERLGCRRLSCRSDAGRLRTLLPHFFA